MVRKRNIKQYVGVFPGFPKATWVSKANIPPTVSCNGIIKVSSLLQTALFLHLGYVSRQQMLVSFLHCALGL